MLHAAAAGNSEQQVKVLTPTSGKQKHPPPWRGPPLLMGSQPRYNVLPLTKLTASLHYTPSACRPECADARRVPDTQACLSDGPAAAAAALPPPPPKWRRTASAGTRRGAASGGGKELHFPGAAAPRDDAIGQRPSPISGEEVGRGAAGARRRRLAAGRRGGTWRWVPGHRGGCCTCRPGAASSSCCCCSSSSAASSGEDRRRRR